MKTCGPMRGSLWICAALCGLTALPAAKAEPEPTADAARRARVFATVGEETITVGELEDLINSRSPFLRARFKEPEVLKRFAEELLEASLLAQGAARRGFDKDSEVSTFVNEALVQLFLQEQLDEKIRLEDVSREEVVAFYEANPKEFSTPEMRRASHILVEDEETAKALIEELKNAEAKAFFTRAKERSLDTETRLRGGDLLFFSEDGHIAGREDAKVEEALVAAAFALKHTGDLVAKPISIGERWSVLKLTGLRPAEVRSLEDSEAAIRRRLWQDKRKDALNARIEALRAELQPEVHPERMAPIRVELETPKPQTGSAGAAR